MSAVSRRSMHLSMWRLTVGLAAAIALALTFNATSAKAETCDTDLVDSSGIEWELSSANMSEGGADAYDGYGYLHLIDTFASDVQYSPTDANACTREEGSREFVYPTETIHGLEVSRKFYVPETGLAFARMLNLIKNPTAAPITVAVRLKGNYGTDSDTAVVATSSGDTVVTTDDAWAALHETDFEDSPVASMWQSRSPLTLDLLDIFATAPTTEVGDTGNGEDDVDLSFNNVTIAPGATVAYMNIEHVAAEGRAAVTGFARANQGGATEFYAGLSAEEAAALKNWPTAPDSDADGLVNTTDNCPRTVNPDQADADADGIGTLCDADNDNDGLSDELELAIGLSLTAFDTDADGIGDKSDQCPLKAGKGADGCPRFDTETVLDKSIPTVNTSRLSKRIDRSAFLKKGLRIGMKCNEKVALQFVLYASSKQAKLSAVKKIKPNVVLARKEIALGDCPGSVTLKPSKRLVGKSKAFGLQLRVVARDVAGNLRTYAKDGRVATPKKSPKAK